MFFLNLSAGEFLAIAGALGGLITALYFFDRSKRKKTVSTLRFWTGAFGAQQEKRRKSVRQPWSLVLQLLSILLLLLALARLQWGLRASEIRNTVLLLDTSSASAWKDGSTTVIEREKDLARRYLSRLNSRERVMLVRVNGLASPVTSFTTDREQLRQEINASSASYSALNIERALTYARQAVNRGTGSVGSVVYIGPKKTVEPFSGGAPGLSVLSVSSGTENCGIRAITVSRADNEDAWRAAVTLRNDGTRNRVLRLSARFGATPFALRRISLGPHEETTASYQFVASSAARLLIRLDPGDNLPADDEASVMVPAHKRVKVVVYSSRPEAWRPLLSANTSLDVEYQSTGQYRPETDAAAIVLDRFTPRVRPTVPSLWVDIPSIGSPLPVKSDAADQVVTQWNTDEELGAGLRARDVLLPRAKVFQIFDKDFVVASTGKGPVAVARPSSESGEKLAIVGFDFVGEPLRYKVTSPLLFANLVRWLAPQVFRSVQVSAEPVGLANIALDSGEQPADIHVTDDHGRTLPFILGGGRLQFFVEVPTIVHVLTRQRERVVSLVLPEVAVHDWNVPHDVEQGLPTLSTAGSNATDLWPVLACLGAVGLLLEWFLFGQQRLLKLRPRASSSPSSRASSRERERELVGK